MTRVLEINVDDLNFGGVFSLVKNVISNKKDDIKIDIGAIEKFENEDNVAFLKKHGSDVYYIGYDGNKILKQFMCYMHLKKLLKQQSYDIVHIHADVANKFIASGLSAKRAGIKKIILHSHSAGVDGHHRILKVIFHKFCRRFLRTIGTGYAACSGLAARWMFPDMDETEITFIHNGVDLHKFRYHIGVRNKIRMELKVKDEILLGHVGRFCYQKNHEYLVAVFEEVRKQGINAKLLFVGDGEEKEKIYAIVKEKKLESDVIFYGTSTRVNELFQAMDIFLLPSHFEGLPIAGVEAQAAGLPVIFSDKITRQAKIITPVKYLSIAADCTEDWVAQIRKYSDYKREDTYRQLAEQKFSIHDTVDGFLSLYKDEREK